MQSAEEFARDIRDACMVSEYLGESGNMTYLDVSEAVKLIRARDKEIVELVGDAYVNMDMPCIPEERRVMVRIAIQERIRPILDSVLRDLEK